MDQITLGTILYHYIPETVLLVTLSLVLTGYEVKPKDIVLIALIGVPVISLIRSLSLTPGFNTLLMLPIFSLLISIICRINIISSAAIFGVGLIVLGITEAATMFLFAKITGHDLALILTDPTLKWMVAIPEYIFLIALITICIRYRLTLINIRELNDLKQRRVENP